MSKVDIWDLYDFEKASDIDADLAKDNPSYGSACANLAVNGLPMDVGFNFENGKVTETSFDYDEEFLNEYDYEEAFAGENIENIGDDVKTAISDTFGEYYRDNTKEISIKETRGTDYQYAGIDFLAVVGEGSHLKTSVSGTVYGGSIHNAKVDGNIALSDVEEEIVNAVQREPFKDYPHVLSFEDIMFSNDGSRNSFSYPEGQDISSLEDFGIATAIFDNGMVASFSFTNNGVDFETDFENGTDEFREMNEEAVGDMSDDKLEDLMIGMSENLNFEFYDFMKADIGNNVSLEITGSSENKIYFRGFAGQELPGEFSGVAEVKENGELFVDPYKIETSGVLNPYLLCESADLSGYILYNIDMCLELSCDLENIKDEGKYTTFEGHLGEPLDSFSFKGRMDNETKNVSIDKDAPFKPVVSHFDIEEALDRNNSISNLKNGHNKSVKRNVGVDV